MRACGRCSHMLRWSKDEKSFFLAYKDHDEWAELLTSAGLIDRDRRWYVPTTESLFDFLMSADAAEPGTTADGWVAVHVSTPASAQLAIVLEAIDLAYAQHVGMRICTNENAGPEARFEEEEIGWIAAEGSAMPAWAAKTEQAKTMAHLVGASEVEIDAAYACIRFLAAEDVDHARILNGRGFGKAHGKIGHRLAKLEPSRRVALDDAFALKLSRLHRGQLPADLADRVGRARA